ncbi:MAG TPA: TipAS antibiotic-recognition domain-containing protein [Sphaerochaeta sp.]|nr:TipAS antibiotic-recognition domain-containing protein [Sphaerochaeta sp.]
MFRGDTHSGYRWYGPEEVNRLQQILFYRELDFELGVIKAILDDPIFDRVQALQERLTERQRHVESLLEIIKKSLEEARGERSLSDKEKAYGDEKVDASKAKLMRMSAKFNQLDKKILEKLAKSAQSHDPGSEQAQAVATLHLAKLHQRSPCKPRPDVCRGS